MTTQQSPEWFAQRKGRLTGSMAGAALGLAPYMSKDDALRALVRSMHDMPTEFEGNVATEWGNANEALARAAYEMETGSTVQDAPFVPFEDWSGASPDGFVEHDGLIEIKCPFGIRKDAEPVFKSIEDQPHYLAQIQVQLHFTGREWCHFWQWTPNGTKLETVNYSPEWIAENLPRLKAFWWKAREADPADFEGPKRVVIDTPEASRLMTEYDELSEAIDNATAKKKEIIERMVQLSKGKNALVSGRNLTLVKRAGSISYAKAIKELLPDADLEPYRGKASESWQVK
jgi:putative phage-type endonuclease